MALMDINLTGATFTDYHLVNVGVGAFQLEHDWFTKEDLVIRTAPAWGGTLLIEGTDYTLGTKSNELSARVSAAGPTRQVFHEITIINATYQSGDLYFSGKYIADSNEAGDINALQDQLGAHAALTGSSAHGAVSAPTASQLITRDAAGRAQVAAPSVAADIARKDTVDDLAGAGRTTQTVKANADAIATLDSAAVKKTGDQTIGGIKTFTGATVQYAPVSGEPSGGTWHKVSDPSPGWFASKTSGWTADQFIPGGLTVDFSSLIPIGTKAVRVIIQRGEASGSIYYRKGNDPNISNTPASDSERSHVVSYDGDITYRGYQAVVWLSAAYTADFAVQFDTIDLYISCPVEYLI